MIDINLIRNNKDLVKENIKKKFQNEKIELVDQIYQLDIEYRKAKTEADNLRSLKNDLSTEIGELVRQNKHDVISETKEKIAQYQKDIDELEKSEETNQTKIKELMMQLPNMIASSVPIGKDESENVQLKEYGVKPNYDFEVPYHVEIIENLGGIDLDAARKVAGNGFYYLIGDIARLHSAILSYARDYMIDEGFTYCIPPFMIREEMVDGVMSFAERDAMMYKIESEDLYLIGTSEHSMISKFKDTIIDITKMPLKYTVYSPCFRKEKGAHGLEERGIYRIHQFEKQEMIVICHPNESEKWFDVMWNLTVNFFLNLNIPVRTLECCSGDLADLKYKSIDVEAWSPRQQKYFEVGSCSNLTEAQARRLNIKIKEKDQKIFAHTLNNTVVAPPRMLIAFLENNLNKDGSINIPKSLQTYMGGITKIETSDEQK